MVRNPQGGNVALGLVVALLAFSSWCRESPRRPTTPASGFLFVGGQPAGGAHVVLHPLEKGQTARAVAITKSDGSFQLTTYRSGDGAPAGDYAVTIYWPDVSISFDDCEGGDLAQHDRLRGVYFDADKTPIRVTIRDKVNSLEVRAADLSAFFPPESPREVHAGKAGPSN